MYISLVYYCKLILVHQSFVFYVLKHQKAVCALQRQSRRSGLMSLSGNCSIGFSRGLAIGVFVSIVHFISITWCDIRCKNFRIKGCFVGRNVDVLCVRRLLCLCNRCEYGFFMSNLTDYIKLLFCLTVNIFYPN